MQSNNSPGRVEGLKSAATSRSLGNRGYSELWSYESLSMVFQHLPVLRYHVSIRLVHLPNANAYGFQVVIRDVRRQS